MPPMLPPCVHFVAQVYARGSEFVHFVAEVHAGERGNVHLGYEVHVGGRPGSCTS